jgi:hypothetical protein
MKFRRTLAVILTVVMVLGISVFVDAAVIQGGFPDSRDSNQANAIAYLKALGTLKGDGDTGNFRPDDFLTRQEFAVIIGRLTALGDPIPDIDITINQWSTSSQYADDDSIAEWANDAVNLVSSLGWVKGYPDGTFGPTNSLTYAEALTVLLRVLGHEDAMGENIAWPEDYIAKAAELGMDMGVDAEHSVVINRADMARLTYNTLFTYRIEQVNDQWQVTDPLIRDISGVKNREIEIIDASTGDATSGTARFVIANCCEDYDGDGFPDIVGYDEGLPEEAVALWEHVQKISALIDANKKETGQRTDEPVPQPVQLAADLKKLADELVNVYKQEDGTDDDFDNTEPAQRAADLKKLADELVNIFESESADTGVDAARPLPDVKPAQLVADLKKLADELVNVYQLAPEVTLIGAESLDELIGTVVRVTFNSEGEVSIFEEITLVPQRLELD